MSATETAGAAPHPLAPADAQLVAAVRAGDDDAFAELYRRYSRRIWGFVRGLVHDDARAEDLTQEAFFSALRRLRVTDSEIAFKPWIFEIARNAAIDQHRRSSRAEEISMDGEGLLRPSDQRRLVGAVAPDSALFEKERMEHLRGALEELSETHRQTIVMRELEGLSYREIGDRLELTRPAVESALFRARRRLEREYEEIEDGRRCEAIAKATARLSEGIESDTDRRRLSRHARRCSSCRCRARELGVEPLLPSRAAAFLPLPFLRRSGGQPAPGGPYPGSESLLPAVTQGAHLFGASLAERAATLLAAAALAGAGGAAIEGAGPFAGAVRDSHPPVVRTHAPAAAAPRLSPGPALTPRGIAPDAVVPRGRTLGDPDARAVRPPAPGEAAPGPRRTARGGENPLALPAPPATPALPGVELPGLRLEGNRRSPTGGTATEPGPIGKALPNALPGAPVRGVTGALPRPGVVAPIVGGVRALARALTASLPVSGLLSRPG